MAHDGSRLSTQILGKGVQVELKAMAGKALRLRQERQQLLVHQAVGRDRASSSGDRFSDSVVKRGRVHMTSYL